MVTLGSVCNFTWSANILVDRSSLTGRAALLTAYPTLKCGATFIESLRGTLKLRRYEGFGSEVIFVAFPRDNLIRPAGSRSEPSIDDLQNRLMTGSRCRRIQKIAHRGDRLPIASDDFADIRSPHFYLEQDLAALFNLRYQHFVRCFDQVLNHEFQEVLHKTNQAWAAASFLRALRIMLATVSLGWAPFFTQ
jgi:hypothetical protein